MPKGIPKNGINKGQFKKGHRMSEETKRKMSLARKGRKLSEEHKRKISESEKGKIISEKTRQKLRNVKKTDQWRINVSNALKGRKPWNKDKKCLELSGKNHWNWQGGKSFEAYGIEFNEDLKEVIRNRDRRKCQICEKTELECGEKLSVHHIDHNKHNNKINNLVSLCRSCHIKVHNNKDYKKYDRT